MFPGALNVVINWKETTSSNPGQAESQKMWTQNKDMGDKWNEQRIRIKNPYRNFEVCVKVNAKMIS